MGDASSEQCFGLIPLFLARPPPCVQIFCLPTKPSFLRLQQMSEMLENARNTRNARQLFHFFASNSSAGPPNILLMLADDLGWNDLSWHNPRVINIVTIDEFFWHFDEIF